MDGSSSERPKSMQREGKLDSRWVPGCQDERLLLGGSGRPPDMGRGEVGVSGNVQLVCLDLVPSHMSS